MSVFSYWLHTQQDEGKLPLLLIVGRVGGLTKKNICKILKQENRIKKEKGKIEWRRREMLCLCKSLIILFNIIICCRLCISTYDYVERIIIFAFNNFFLCVMFFFGLVCLFGIEIMCFDKNDIMFNWICYKMAKLLHINLNSLKYVIIFHRFSCLSFYFFYSISLIIWVSLLCYVCFHYSIQALFVHVFFCS